jgi:hypothetical protein
MGIACPGQDVMTEVAEDLHTPDPPVDDRFTGVTPSRYQRTLSPRYHQPGGIQEVDRLTEEITTAI